MYGMFYQYHSNCSIFNENTLLNNSNYSDMNLWRVVSSYSYLSWQSVFIYVLAILRLLGFGFNAFALAVFLIKRKLPLRLKLIAFSVTEVFLCSASFTTALAEIISTNGRGIRDSGLPLVQIYEAANYISFVAVMSRNWIITFISISKCDAFMRPIRWRARSLCHQKFELCILLFIWITSSFLVFLYACTYVKHYCTPNGNLVLISFPYGFTIFELYSTVHFVVQSVLPVFGVMITCVLILLLLKHRRNQFSHQHSSRSMTLTSDGHTQRLMGRSTDHATFLCLALALVFVPMELPAVFANYFPIIYLGHISNWCMALDSLANFFLYFALNRYFRRNVVDLCPFKSFQFCGRFTTANSSILADQSSNNHRHLIVGSVSKGAAAIPLMAIDTDNSNELSPTMKVTRVDYNSPSVRISRLSSSKSSPALMICSDINNESPNDEIRPID